jgi:cellulose synthase/poly-beta-1,6-N-acetylglucosamine synthase-like glycosyltransferase
MSKIYKKAVVVLPTYNEKDNIIRIIKAILKQNVKKQEYELSVLVVDDSSPDGTPQLVEKFISTNNRVYLIEGKKKGLGNAYVKGLSYAIQILKADVVFEMDADFSHDPKLIPLFLKKINKGNDFVIGSRYIKGGSIPNDWPVLRKLNSKWGNAFARHIAGLKNIKDCTSGYRAISATLLTKINLHKIGAKGYSFQMNLLHQAVIHNAKITEIPLKFVDRVNGSSKLRRSDITEFILNAFYLRLPILKLIVSLIPLAIIGFFVWELLNFIGLSSYFIHFSLTTIILTLSLIMTAQGVFNLFLMLYAWEDTDRIKEVTPVVLHNAPKYSFSILIPARHEEHVIADTIRAASYLDYPENLKEILVICRDDDLKTIKKVQETITRLKKKNLHLITFSGMPINKPHSLNVGLQNVTKDVVAVFDAEDQPHRNILNIINETLIQGKADIVQSGVQLMNFRSSWFSALNVLEYFFWFKSSLHFFAARGIVPLGGNTVFIKKYWLDRINGWDENCLTEDADIGIRLSAMGADIEVVYDEEFATQEETPATIGEFIRQRTRWNQGFLQVFGKSDWLNLSSLLQKLLAVYILLLPGFQALFMILNPLSLFIAFELKLPFLVAFFSIVPSLLLLLQIITYNIGLYEFTKHNKLKYPLLTPFRVFVFFYPYQLLLAFSAARAIRRLVLGNTAWEKTLHINAHRDFIFAEAI